MEDPQTAPPRRLGRRAVLTGAALGASALGLPRSAQAAAGHVEWSPAPGALTTAAIAAQLPSGGVLRLQPGLYTITSPVLLPRNVSVLGAGAGQTTIEWTAPGSTAEAIRLGASLSGTTTNLATSAVEGDEQLSVVSTSGISAGDLLQVGANRAWSRAENTGEYTGEIVRVAGTPASGVVPIAAPLRDDYGTAHGASLVKLSDLSVGVRFAGFTLVNTARNGTTSKLLQLSQCQSVVVEDLELVGSDRAGLALANCVDFSVRDCVFRDFTNNPDADRYGYGIEVTQASESGSVTGCHFRRCRTGFTTSGFEAKRGVIRDVVVSGCTAREMHSNSLDTHAMAADVVFTGNEVSGGNGVGISVRGRRCVVSGNTVRDCGAGVTVGRDASGTSVSGNDIRRIGDKDGAIKIGVQISGAEDVSVRDNRIAFARAAGINVVNGEPPSFPVKRLSIIGNEITDCGAGATTAQWGGVHVTAGVEISDFTVFGNRFAAAPPGTTFQEPGAERGRMLGAVRVRSTNAFGLRLVGNLVDGLYCPANGQNEPVKSSVLVVESNDVLTNLDATAEQNVERGSISV